jgi:hypothetical protein
MESHQLSAFVIPNYHITRKSFSLRLDRRWIAARAPSNAKSSWKSGALEFSKCIDGAGVYLARSRRRGALTAVAQANVRARVEEPLGGL